MRVGGIVLPGGVGMRYVMAGLLAWSAVMFGQDREPSSKGVNFYSLEKEVEIGRQAAATLAVALPFVHEARLEAYVARLGAALAEHADHEFTYSFSIYEDRKVAAAVPVGMAMPADAFQGRQKEPVALPGGPILLPMSVLAGAGNEAELAFQLAHAMAHVALRHGTRRATREQLFTMASINLPNVSVPNRPAVAGDVYRVGLLKLARDCEIDADHVAIRIIAAAGYDPEAATRFLSLATSDGSQAFKMFSAHPLNSVRLEALRLAREKLPSRKYSAANGEFAEIEALAATVR